MKALGYAATAPNIPLSPYIPDFFADSITDVDFGLLHKIGLRHVFLDVDQTLRRAYSSSLEAEVIDFFVDLKKKNWFESITLVSNNNFNLSHYSEPLGAVVFQPFWSKRRMVRKPNPEFYEHVLKQLDIKPGQTVMIGDKVKFDIAGAKRVGLYTVLVNPRGRDYWYDLLLLSRFRDRRSLKAALKASQTIDPSTYFGK